MFPVHKFNGHVNTAGTHDGVFHADDVMAAAVIRLVFPNARIVRTRDQKQLNTCDIIFDVGGAYDPERGRFDHHQTGRAKRYENGIEYSSLGLVWEALAPRLDLDPRIVEAITLKICMPIDATDNGQKLTSSSIDNFKANGKPVQVMTFSNVIACMNPNWHEEQDYDACFEQAVEFAKGHLTRAIAREQGLLLAEDTVREALLKEQNGIIVLEQFCPWQDIVVAESTTAMFVVFPNGNDWKVQAIPTKPGSFDKRKALPFSWGGKSGIELANITGVEDAVFAHPGLFICGAKTKAGALKLAHLALNG
jgi:uncharacterized UPF0160 family protein